jgi:flagellin
MYINNNPSASQAATILANSSVRLGQSLARLTTGSKIVSPADDSAGMAVSMKLGGQVARLDAASNNVANAIAFTQTQDGYLSKIGEAFDRMQSLAIRALDVTLPADDLGSFSTEFFSLRNYVQSVAQQSFNGVSLFDGSMLNVTTDGDGATFAMTGINLGAFTYMHAVDNSMNNKSDAATTVGDLQNAINLLAVERARLGSSEEVLSHYADQITTLKNNLSAADSRITDVDVAEESVQYAKQNILVQSGTAMLAQANLQPQSVLKLLG